MKRYHIAFLSLIFFLLIAPGAGAKKTVVLASGEWQPFVSKHLKHCGLFSRIVTEAFALKGVAVEYVFLPWKRGETESRAGRIDGNIAYALSAPLMQDFYYSDPIGKGTKVFFHLKSFQFDWDTLDDLDKIPIGAPIGYLFGDKFSTKEKSGKLSVHRAPSSKGLFQMLLAGRIKLIPQTMEVGHAILQNKFSPGQVQKITYHPRPLFETTFHIILTRKKDRNRRLMDLFNQGLKELKQNGKYELYLEESWAGDYFPKKTVFMGLPRKNEK